MRKEGAGRGILPLGGISGDQFWEYIDFCHYWFHCNTSTYLNKAYRGNYFPAGPEMQWYDHKLPIFLVGWNYFNQFPPSSSVFPLISIFLLWQHRSTTGKAFPQLQIQGRALLGTSVQNDQAHRLGYLWRSAPRWQGCTAEDQLLNFSASRFPQLWVGKNFTDFKVIKTCRWKALLIIPPRKKRRKNAFVGECFTWSFSFLKHVNSVWFWLI